MPQGHGAVGPFVGQTGSSSHGKGWTKLDSIAITMKELLQVVGQQLSEDKTGRAKQLRPGVITQQSWK